MGDRAQIIIRRENTDIHFYTHWRGSELPQILATGLKRGQSRWGDPSYLSRILFCELVSQSNLYDTTGFGISTQYGDSFPETDLIVDMDSQKVQYLDFIWSFEEYINLPKHTWSALRG